MDGLDASGKTTQALRLTSFLQSQGKTFCLRVHPAKDNFFGSHAQKFLQANGKSAHFASALFYMFDVLYSVLKYSWRNYDYVIFVRYLLGTAYLPSPLYKIAYHFFATIVPKPEKLFFIDVKPEVAYERITKRTEATVEMFEKPKALQKIRRRGLEIATIGKWLIVDGEKPEDDVELTIRHSLGLH
ncbi:MAG: thymidylate kinase [Candidatus Bathyarchaeota archaeon]|nr:thymidylate kinase [Candidatus Bathyarchaeota archaeon]